MFRFNLGSQPRRRTFVLLQLEFATARSDLPSRSKSPTATEYGELPTPKVWNDVKPAQAVAKQRAKCVRTENGHGDVDEAVPIEESDGDRRWQNADA